MSLLSVAFEHVPELDEERVAILGSSRGGAVALLAAVRDRRIDAVVECSSARPTFSVSTHVRSRGGARRRAPRSSRSRVLQRDRHPARSHTSPVPHGPGLSIRSPVLPPSVRDSRSRHRACLAHIGWEGGSQAQRPPRVSLVSFLRSPPDLPPPRPDSFRAFTEFLPAHPAVMGLLSRFLFVGPRFASGFLQIPPRDGHPCPRLSGSVLPPPVRNSHSRHGACLAQNPRAESYAV